MPFTKKSTAEDVTEGLDLSGKTYVVTGVNSGIGHETLRVLALRGAHVIGLARTLEKAQAACDSVTGNTTPLACELSDMDSVAACAREIVAMGIVVDGLICNAGILAPPELQVVNGLELQFLTNHMGHFLLTYLLQDALKKSADGRIVLLSSAAHRVPVRNGIDFENLDGSAGYKPWRCYGQSKLANLLAAKAFNKRLAGTSVTANAVHPGSIETNIARNARGFVAAMSNSKLALNISRLFLKSIPQGAATQCYVATRPELKGVGGRYFADNREAKNSKLGNSEDLADRLWDFSVDYLQDYLA